MAKKKKQDGRKNNGGKRAGAGRPRKPKTKKRKAIYIMVDPVVLKENGGEEAVKELLKKTLK